MSGVSSHNGIEKTHLQNWFKKNRHRFNSNLHKMVFTNACGATQSVQYCRLRFWERFIQDFFSELKGLCVTFVRPRKEINNVFVPYEMAGIINRVTISTRHIIAFHYSRVIMRDSLSIGGKPDQWILCEKPPVSISTFEFAPCFYSLKLKVTSDHMFIEGTRYHPKEIFRIYVDGAVIDQMIKDI